MSRSSQKYYEHQREFDRINVAEMMHDVERFEYLNNISEREVWKDIPGYEGIYQASSLGNIKNNNKIINGGVNGKGYKTIQLWKDGKYKGFAHHQIIAITFLNHKRNGNTIIVDHIDRDVKNNRVDNLQLITNRENYIKDRNHRTNVLIGAYYNKDRNQWYSRIRINGKDKYLGTFKNELECHNAYKKALNGTK